MKKNVRFFALIMSILMILSFASACDRTSSTEETQYSSDTEKAITTETETESADTSSSTTDTAPESTAPESSEESSSQSSDTEVTEETTDTEETDKPKETHTIIENKKTEYTMVIPDSNSTEFTKHANDLRASFLEEFSVTVQMIKESTYKTLHGGTMDGKKIVIGVLKNDPISSDIQKSLTYNSFSIQMVNGSLYIIGYNAETTLLAMEYFIQTYMLCDHSDSLKFDEGLIYETSAAFPIGNITIGGNHIATYSIVYYDSHYGKLAAQELQAALSDMAGITLPIKSDKEAVGQYEILIGKTNRAESKAVRAAYDRPNVNYDIAEKNGKLVVMAEGFSTLEVVIDKLIQYLDTLDPKANIIGGVISDNILISDNAANPVEGNLLTRAEDTEVRIMAWNMGGPGTYGKLDLAEKLADTILKNLPDVFGTNEFYDPASGAYRTTFDAVLREISEYYYEIESDNDFPDDARLESFVKGRGPRPQKIFVRKDAGIKVIAAGWRYTDYQKDINYRSFPWAVLETKEGDKFIYTVSHYTNMTNDNVAAIEQLKTVEHAQKQSGIKETLPTILSGDLWTSPGKGAYKYFTDAGYKDAQKTAKVNANRNTSHSTFHDYGKLEPTGRAITDLIFYSAGMVPLQFKVITSVEAIDSSDHSPLVCDFKFN